jgi:CubicO group peptidase (beta-lactamase class C family)
VTLAQVIAWFSDKPLEFTPGDRYSYSNSGYAVLTKLIETVSDCSYADYLQRCIFDPSGMKDSGYDRSELILAHRASGYRPAETGYYHAFVQLTGQHRLEIFPESATEFFLKVVDAQLTFVTDESGWARPIILHQCGQDQVATRHD